MKLYLGILGAVIAAVGIGSFYVNSYIEKSIQRGIEANTCKSTLDRQMKH